MVELTGDNVPDLRELLSDGTNIIINITVFIIRYNAVNISLLICRL